MGTGDLNPCIMGAAGWTLTPGLMVQQYASATHGSWILPRPRHTVDKG
jgi:hypothetical protein